MKIIAAVVTHNRANLLDRCISGIIAQTRHPDEILVVNNGSTDNTLDILSKYNVKIINQENSGSAGGWYSAIKYSLENDFDYIWLMDDDGCPNKDALSLLESNYRPEFACLSSVVVNENNPNQFVFPFPSIRKNGIPDTFRFWIKFRLLNSLPLDYGLYYPYAHLFNGALINLEAVKKIGNVNKDYFMYGDEVDYYFRLKKFGDVKSLLTAVHYHPDVLKRKYSIQRIYYNLKNNIINYYKHHDLPFIRSLVAPLIILSRVSKTNGFLFMISLLIGKNAPAFYKGFFRGLGKKIGKDF